MTNSHVDTVVIVALVVLGAVIAIYGLAKAHGDARRQLNEEQQRIDRTHPTHHR